MTLTDDEITVLRLTARLDIQDVLASLAKKCLVFFDCTGKIFLTEAGRKALEEVK